MSAIEQIKQLMAQSNIPATDTQIIAIATRQGRTVEQYLAQLLAFKNEPLPETLSPAEPSATTSTKWTDAPTVRVNGITHSFEQDRTVLL